MRVFVTALVMARLTCAVLATEPAAAPTPKEDLKALPGSWALKSAIGLGKDGEAQELGLGHAGTSVRIEGNRLTVEGEQQPLVFVNDVPLAQEHKQVFEGNRLVFFTRPDGKGVLGSYKVSGDKLEVRYPHTCHCTRTGVILSFERVKK